MNTGARLRRVVKAGRYERRAFAETGIREAGAGPPAANNTIWRARRERREAAVAPLLAILAECFPKVFCRPPPLAIGIDKQILARGDSRVDPAELNRALRHWVQRPGYLDAVAHREPRRNLDGSPAGLPTADQQREAALRVYGPRGLARLGIDPAANQGNPEAGDMFAEARITAQQPKKPRGEKSPGAAAVNPEKPPSIKTMMEKPIPNTNM